MLSTRPKFSFILCDPVESFGNLEDFAAVLRCLKQLGFDGVEFNLTSAALASSEALLQLVKEIELPIVSFLTGANYFGRGLCLSSPHPDVRQNAIETLCQFTSTAAQFGALLVVGQMQGLRSDEPDRHVAEERIEDALRQVAAAAEQNGATVVVEPVNHLQCGFHNTLQAVLQLSRRIGSPRLKPMLDSFHINIEEQGQIEPILRAGSDLAHYHLCESNGGLLGSGHIDVASICEALDSIRYQGYVSVKVFREPWDFAAKSTMEQLKFMGLVRRG